MNLNYNKNYYNKYIKESTRSHAMYKDDCGIIQILTQKFGCGHPHMQTDPWQTRILTCSSFLLLYLLCDFCMFE